MEKSKRLLSLDTLRGFDMFWIMGGDHICHALAKCTQWSFFIWLSTQMEHVEWNGFRMYDLIYPLFIFISGVSMTFSFSKRLERGDRKKDLYLSIVRRSIILIIFGAIHNGLLDMDWENMRYASVLGRIGLAWGFAAVIFLNTTIRGQIIWLVGILISYCAVLLLIPVPGYGAGVLTTEGSLVAYIDRLILPGRLYLEVHDPEGILSTLPSISTALLGVIAGHIIRLTNETLSSIKKGTILLIMGIVLLGLGQIWGLFFPINKNLWTSSFVLYAGGWSYILLSIFYLIIDVFLYKKWALPFIFLGVNSITVYMCWNGLISFSSTARYLFTGVIQLTSDTVQPVLEAITATLISWLFFYFLYKKKVFLKI